MTDYEKYKLVLNNVKEFERQINSRVVPSSNIRKKFIMGYLQGIQEGMTYFEYDPDKLVTHIRNNVNRIAGG